MNLDMLFKEKILYVKLWKNEVEFIHVKNGKSLKEKSNEEFSSSRLLIANFSLAESFLKEVLKKLNKKYNKILVHPIELVEGGISEVEERVFVEVFERIGGKLVKLHVGDSLNSKQVIDKLNN